MCKKLLYCSTFVAVSLLNLSLPSSAGAQENPQCTLDGEDQCAVEMFNSDSTGTKSCPWMSDNGFDFRCINSTAPTVADYTNLGHGLEFVCDGLQIDFPDGARYNHVTLVFRGTAGRVNFIAFDANNNVIDETLKFNGTNDGAEILHLGTGSNNIQHIHMIHSDGDCDKIQCLEPVITEIRACDLNFP